MDTADVYRDGLSMYDGRSDMHVVPTKTGWFRLDQTSAPSDVRGTISAHLGAEDERNRCRLQRRAGEMTAGLLWGAALYHSLDFYWIQRVVLIAASGWRSSTITDPDILQIGVCVTIVLYSFLVRGGTVNIWDSCISHPL